MHQPDDGDRGAWPLLLPRHVLDRVPAELEVRLVSHTHWDREWYRTAEDFASRLVAVVDRVLDLLEEDPSWSFVLDGQAIIVEDYLAARPLRRAEFEAQVRARRLSIGPWYVQPDSLLPTGESHIRNLLEGQAVSLHHGGVSRTAYTPDSFGHPATFPMIFAGFGLDAFVYWRGHGDEIDQLPAAWTWVAPDDSEIDALHLEGSYLGAATLDPEPSVAAARLRDLATALSGRSPTSVVLMNGMDHLGPDAHTASIVRALEELTGWHVERTTLDTAIADGVPAEAPRWSGPLQGGRGANLLPGVWSARTPLKVTSRLAESAVFSAERAAAKARLLGHPDEQPTLRRLRRDLLANQAHDSIGGCSTDAVHRTTAVRSEATLAGAAALCRRVTEAISGLGPEHAGPWDDEWDVAVWNPSGHPRTGVVRIPVDGAPAFRVRSGGVERHPAHALLRADAGFTVDGRPARLVAADPERDRLSPEHEPMDLEVEVVDVPAGGWKRLAVRRGVDQDDVVDEQRTLTLGTTTIEVDDAGSLTITIGDRRFTGLLGIVDRGDRGDTYDADVLDDEDLIELRSLSVTRRRHPSGRGELVVDRSYVVPGALDDTRTRRAGPDVRFDLTVVASICPTGAVDVDIAVAGSPRDHRLQIVVGSAPSGVTHASTFGQHNVAPPPPSAEPYEAPPGWAHPRPRTWCHQGWIASEGLLALVPGLHEGEVTPDGTVLVTLLRSVGWLSRPDLRTRPGRAGPSIPVPGAQNPDGIRAQLRFTADPGDALDRWHRLEELEQALHVVIAGEAPSVAASEAVLEVEHAVLSAFKPAEDGASAVLRLWNPRRAAVDARVSGGLMSDITAEVIDLDESGERRAQSAGDPLRGANDPVTIAIPHDSVRTVRLSRITRRENDS